MGVGKFDEYVRRYRASVTAKVREGDLETRRFLRAFRDELMVALATSRAHLWDAFDKLLDEKAVLMASIVRNAMAAAVLRALKPDLIIFDEFQRFRELMSRSEKDLSKDLRVRAVQKNIIDILLARTEPARLLMLSATPYEALTAGINARHRHEDGDSDFFEILKFLFEYDAQGARHFQRVRDQFGIVENELRRNSPDSHAACQARGELSRLLLKVMCRTERPRQRRQGILLEARPLLLTDLRVFEDFATPIDNHVQSWAVPLWASVPAPIQTLGSKYQCWKGTRFPGSKPVLRRKQVTDGFVPRTWPHPKLRGLFAALPSSSLSLPWLRPSLPWWTLKGPWSSSNAAKVDGKMLLFSRFAATPAAVSGLVSYDVETRMLGSASETRRGYEAVAKASHFKVTADAPAIFTLFFASSFLASVNPLLRGVPETVTAAKAEIRRQLRGRLKVKVLKNVKRRLMKPHVLLISLEMREGSWKVRRDAWVKALISGGSVGRQAAESALHDWEAKADATFDVLAESEFDLLVNLALGSPGVVVERALRRHWTQVPSDKSEAFHGTMQRESVQALLLGGFRKYFDKPWFATALRRAGLRSEAKTKGRSKDYPSALRAAIIAGNLESVLDEHFWMMARSGKPWDEGLKELTDALNVSGGRALFRERGKNTSRFDLRCHVAMPLHPGKTESNQLTGERPARPDQVRHAFNSPFWPYVVSTTSVGQEGLDFHLWCRSVCHWDPARGPVELEQREGRVARFAGLAIRRALATHKERPTLPADSSPWASISDWAKTIEDPATQLQPWWCLDDAETVQCYFSPAGSREHQQRELLERARALYRLVLGATNPEPLLEELEVDSTVTPEWAASASLNLVPPP